MYVVSVAGTLLTLCSFGCVEGREMFLPSVLVKRALDDKLLLVLYGTVGALHGCFGRFRGLQSRGLQKVHSHMTVSQRRAVKGPGPGWAGHTSYIHNIPARTDLGPFCISALSCHSQREQDHGLGRGINSTKGKFPLPVILRGRLSWGRN